MKRKRSISPLPSPSGGASNIGSQLSQVRQNETWIQCKGCPKKIEEKSILLHLRSKKCKQHYSANEYSDLIRTRNQARKLQQKKARSNPEPHTAATNIAVIDESNTIEIDQTNIPFHLSQQSQINPDESLIQCKGCPKKILENSMLLHLRSKNCRKHYSDNDYSNLIIRRDERRKLYNQQLKQDNNSIQVKNTAYKRQTRMNTKKASRDSSITAPNAALSAPLKAAPECHNVSYIQCKGCPKNIPEKSILLHLRSKKCRSYYSDVDYENFITKRKEARKERTKVHNRQTRMNQNNDTTMKDRILAFKRDIIDGPNFVCCSCKRKLFKNSVKFLHMNEISKLLQKIDDIQLQESGLESFITEPELILCHTCHNSFKSNKVPSINENNGLKLDDVPPELVCLSDLEQQLIAQLLLFMKIKKLPTTRMGAVVDQVISVPIEAEDISR
jgi:hypothetical protein